MSCCCSDEICPVWEETTPRARRAYTCCECSGPIRVGERHHKVSSLFDGSWSTSRSHERCHAISSLLQADCDVYCVGMLRECLHAQSAGYLPEDLRPYAKGLMFKFSEHYYEHQARLLSKRRYGAQAVSSRSVS